MYWRRLPSVENLTMSASNGKLPSAVDGLLRLERVADGETSGLQFCQHLYIVPQQRTIGIRLFDFKVPEPLVVSLLPVFTGALASRR